MFNILGNLVKASVGVLIETPISVIADVVTLGGTLSDKQESYTATAVKNVMENVEKITRK